MRPRPRAYDEIFTSAYRGRRVLVTGHNGFVGSWLSLWLARCGAEVVGLSLAPEPRFGPVVDLGHLAGDLHGDIRNLDTVVDAVRVARPEIVFHLAAQAFVLPSYADPLATFATNVMGTAHLLEAVRRQPDVERCIVVTSDKCYATAASAHVESDPLGGDDPYSASKAAAELVSHAYATSFFGDKTAVATARAGNIVGGGDWALGRILPDCVHALHTRSPLELRHPEAIRPWQHVLDAVAGYLLLGAANDDAPREATAGAWNFGPAGTCPAATVGDVVARAERAWQSRTGEGLVDLFTPADVTTEAERTVLMLDSTRARDELGWRPLLELGPALDWAMAWYAAALRDDAFDAAFAVDEQIGQYLALDRALAPEAAAPEQAGELGRSAHFATATT